MVSATVPADLSDLFTDFEYGETQLFHLEVREQTNYRPTAVESQQPQVNINNRPTVDQNHFEAQPCTRFISLSDSPKPSEMISCSTTDVAPLLPDVVPLLPDVAPLLPVTVEEVNSSIAIDGTQFVPEIGNDINYRHASQHKVPNLDQSKVHGRRREEARGGGEKSSAGSSREAKSPRSSGNSTVVGSTKCTDTLLSKQINQLTCGIHQEDASIFSSSSATQGDPKNSGKEYGFKNSDTKRLAKRREQNKRAAEKCRIKRKLEEKQLAKDLEEAERSKKQKLQEIMPLYYEMQELKSLLQNHQTSGNCRIHDHLRSLVDS